MISETVIDIRYPDADAMGIVHHAVYPVWYEIARMDFFAKMGFAYSDMHTLGINPPIVDLHVSFCSAVIYPGQVAIRTSIRFFAPKKLELSYELFSGETLVSSAVTLHIWTGSDMRSLDMEKNLPDIYEKIRLASLR